MFSSNAWNLSVFAKMLNYSFNASFIIYSGDNFCTPAKANISTFLSSIVAQWNYKKRNQTNYGFTQPPCFSLSLSLHHLSSSLPSTCLLSVPWMGRVVIRPCQPSPALLPDRCQQGAAALAWVSWTTTAPREWGNQARVIYAGPEHTGQLVSSWSVCVFVSMHSRVQEPASPATSGYKSIVTRQTEFMSQSACNRLVWFEKGKEDGIKKCSSKSELLLLTLRAEYFVENVPLSYQTSQNV